MGVGVLTVNKICFKHFVLLLLCVYVHNWSVSQWKQYKLLKTGMLTVNAFDAFIHIHDKSKHYLSHRSAQRIYLFTQCITSVTNLHRGDIALHSAYKIDYH